jgi:hypothetical protein
MLITLYKYRLLKWFRYTLVLPFQPKKGQTYHIILCSNYEAGVRATRNFYCSKTSNARYSPDNRSAYEQFKNLHPELFINIRGNARARSGKCCGGLLLSMKEVSATCYALISESLKEMFPKFPKPLSG